MNRYLFVIDYQNDFVDGALGFPGAEKLDERIAAKVRQYGKGHVLFTRDTHFENYMDTREGKNLPVPHCIKGTEGWKIHPQITEALGDALLVEKPTFGSVKLPQIVAQLADDPAAMTIELLGVCTDICVASNALLLKAHFPEAALRVRRACCAGVTPAKHEAALETMSSCQIDVI